jgi:hypothetical protein
MELSRVGPNQNQTPTSELRKLGPKRGGKQGELARTCTTIDRRFPRVTKSSIDKSFNKLVKKCFGMDFSKLARSWKKFMACVNIAQW